MSRNNASNAWELLYVCGVLAAFALIFVTSRPDRPASRSNSDEREIIRVEARPPLAQVPVSEDPAAAVRDELRRSEESAKQAKQDLEAVKAEIEEKKAEMRKLAAESEEAAARQKQETEKAVRELSAEREKLEAASKEAADKARDAREEMAKAQESLEKQRAMAAQQGIAESFGRGRTVEMQTRFDPRTKRDPQMLRTVPEGPQAGVAQAPGGQVTSLPAGAGEFSEGRQAINFETARSINLDNRLKATETYFEMRRINRAARALEAGPRVTMEQAVRMASVHAPRRPTDVDLDPVSGEISWPLALGDDFYSSDREIIQEKFRERAAGVSINIKRFNTVREAVARLNLLLKENIDRYLSGHYGKARNFLDGLLYEFELPLR